VRVAASRLIVRRGRIIWRAVLTCWAVILVAGTSRAANETQNREFLEISGIELKLGMEQSLVFQKLHEKKLIVIQAVSTTDWASWALCASPDCDPQLGEVGFKNGHLHYVLKRWAQTEKATEVIVALYGVIRDIERRSLSPCRPGARDDVFYPGQEVKQVELVCGEHMVIRVVQTHSAYPPFPVNVDQELWTEIPKGANFAGR
jgi:hypothetical protein